MSAIATEIDDATIPSLLRLSKHFYEVFSFKERRGIAWHVVNRLQTYVGKPLSLGDMQSLDCIKKYKAYAVKLALIELHEKRLVLIGKEFGRNLKPADISVKTLLTAQPLMVEMLNRYCRAVAGTMEIQGTVNLADERTFRKFSAGLYAFFDDDYSKAWKQLLKKFSEVLSVSHQVPDHKIASLSTDGEVWLLLHCFSRRPFADSGSYDADRISYDAQNLGSIIPAPNLADALARMEERNLIMRNGKGLKASYALNGDLRPALHAYVSDTNALLNKLKHDLANLGSR